MYVLALVRAIGSKKKGKVQLSKHADKRLHAIRKKISRGEVLTASERSIFKHFMSQEIDRYKKNK